ARASADRPTAPSTAAAAPPAAAQAATPLPVQPELDAINSQAPAAVAPAPAAAPRAARGGKASTAGRKPKARAQSAVRKLFVLDTNVLLHDPTSLFRFEEHDIFLPMMTLEELDHQKKGMSEVARNARQVSRSLDALVHDADQLD